MEALKPWPAVLSDSHRLITGNIKHHQQLKFIYSCTPGWERKDIQTKIALRKIKRFSVKDLEKHCFRNPSISPSQLDKTDVFASWPRNREVCSCNRLRPVAVPFAEKHPSPFFAPPGLSSGDCDFDFAHLLKSSCPIGVQHALPFFAKIDEVENGCTLEC